MRLSPVVLDDNVSGFGADIGYKSECVRVDRQSGNGKGKFATSSHANDKSLWHVSEWKRGECSLTDWRVLIDRSIIMESRRRDTARKSGEKWMFGYAQSGHAEHTRYRIAEGTQTDVPSQWDASTTPLH